MEFYLQWVLCYHGTSSLGIVMEDSHLAASTLCNEISSAGSDRPWCRCVNSIELVGNMS
jgi:hypothetical protein